MLKRGASELGKYHPTGEAAGTMVRISVLYPHQADAWFDFDYYLGTHMPMSLRLLGDAIVSVSVERGVDPGAPWTPPAYRALCHFESESAEKFAAAFLPNAAVLQEDMKKCTDIVPVIQLSEIMPVPKLTTNS
jgi:uncharacterized protein (TIGR02118 family)